MAQFRKVAGIGDLAEGKGKQVEIEGQTLALFRVEGKFYAIDNSCVHQGGPLADGVLEGTLITCPWHAWKFDITTGTSPINPNARCRTFPVKVVGDDLLVEV